MTTLPWQWRRNGLREEEEEELAALEDLQVAESAATAKVEEALLRTPR